MCRSNYWKARPVLVTGGCGFVGSHVARTLVGLGASVRIVDDLSTGRIESIRDLRPYVDFIEADITSSAVADDACADVDTIFDLAATGVSGIIAGSTENHLTYSGVLMPALSILEASRKARTRRFLYFSSSCVYGLGGRMRLSEKSSSTGPLPNAHRAYALAKRAAETQALLQSSMTDLEVVALRPFNVVGPGATFDYMRANVVPALVRRAHERTEELRVFGTGTQRRSFIDVRDAANISVMVAQLRSPPTILNLSAPGIHTVSEIADLVRLAVSPALKLAFDKIGPMGVVSRVADTSRLLSVAGDYSFFSIEESVQAVVEDFRLRGEYG